MFIDSLKNMPSYKKLLEEIKMGSSPISIHGLNDDNLGHFFYGINKHSKKQILIVTKDELKAKSIFEDLKNFANSHVEIFPSKEIFFYDVDALSLETVHERLKVMTRLIKGEKIVVVTCIEAILSKVMNAEIFKKLSTKIRYDEKLNLKKFVEDLTIKGYERVNMVEGKGQFSVRGGIIDFFSPGEQFPIRIELFDDEIDSIRNFNISDQRSMNKLDSAFIPPAKEILILDEYKSKIIEGIERDLSKVSKNKRIKDKSEKLNKKFLKYIDAVEGNLSIANSDLIIPYIPGEYVSSLVDYFSQDSLIVLHEFQRIEEKANELKEQFVFKFSNIYESGELLPNHEKILYRYDEIIKKVEEKITIITMSLLNDDSKFNPKVSINFTTKGMQSFHNNMNFLIEELNHYKYRGYKVIIFSGTEERGIKLEKILREKGLECSFVKDKNRDIKSGQVFILAGTVNGGFEYPFIKQVFISDNEIFKVKKKKSRKIVKKDKQEIVSFLNLNVGDYVVHENHGIGQYIGIEQLNVQGIKKDYFTIKYAGNDKLYVPVDQMNLIQKYIGSDEAKPKISRLSNSDWTKTKNKAKKSIEDMAKDLLELYAKRETSKGFEFSKDNVWQGQFEEMFPYEETEAQLRSINEIKKDMEKPKPMDRLLCGDVGYGKTEVAIRAAFKAIMDGKQVAFLVPTTILAQQHYNTIQERFAGFPIRVEMLSRFKTLGAQHKVIVDLKKGIVDMVIGTHRLLSQDVKFYDLGLIIIDEEQRFGVKHKEKLKRLKENADVLTLTATPIPRTLHMSLIGIRDMSVLDEPPEERYPVQTYVVEFNEQIIRDAIIKEINRNGQVYYVYNRVETIHKVAKKLKELVPEARIIVGHGQMSERELEKVMLSFIDGEYDVLLCTTIIETGLDIPNVNTIIVQDSDKMGLSQLYQLRGRVGRTNRVAFAYFTYEKDKVLSEVAEKRLRAIKEFTEFGSGFKIAMRDLEIRGAGNLLGVEQHGHIEAIGYDLYVKFLNGAIKKLKGEKVEDAVETTIELNINGYISKEYIPDEEQKIEIYKKIARTVSNEDYNDLVDELIDRFGDIPQEVKNLIDISYIKNIASKCLVSVIFQKNDIISLEFDSIKYITPELIHYLSVEYGMKISFDLSDKPIFKFRIKKDVIKELKELIEKISCFIFKVNDI
ncbi:transcription-repair coupling factor [Acidilutibacter cellobiosedens]|uniref:Transcription-repair-coupling factor n=2 Tax=Tissierellia TaxID=1737404 RepID=A0A410QHQ4_9FIRM|nr:transcription-repair coupling factor [Tissierellaceae bacterium]QAT63491.1 transcription-repair coupling factor [Acidilutibacter cellobiosedens]